MCFFFFFFVAGLYYVIFVCCGSIFRFMSANICFFIIIYKYIYIHTARFYSSASVDISKRKCGNNEKYLYKKVVFKCFLLFLFFFWSVVFPLRKKKIKASWGEAEGGRERRCWERGGVLVTGGDTRDKGGKVEGMEKFLELSSLSLSRCSICRSTFGSSSSSSFCMFFSYWAQLR